MHLYIVAQFVYNTWSCVHMGKKTSLLSHKFHFKDNSNSWAFVATFTYMRSIFSSKNLNVKELFVCCEQLPKSFESNKFQLLKSFNSDQLQKYTLGVQLRKIWNFRKILDQIWWVFKTKKLLGSKNGKWTIKKWGQGRDNRERWVEF